VIADSYFDGFRTPKYAARSSVRRWLIRRFVRSLFDLIAASGPVGSVLEVGMGEGFVSGLMLDRFPSARFSGVDASSEAIARVRERFPRIAAAVGSAYDLSEVPGGPHDLILCIEVLEHLDAPERAVDAIANARPRRAVVTVPHEPFFRLSNLAAGKNVRRLGNDPEHIQQFRPWSLRSLLERRFEVVALRGSYPWLLALVR
jgi:hypothetical protein